MNQTRHSISAFFPAYNDGGTIASLVVMAMKTLPELTDDFEVVVVNDGSTDHTAAVLSVLQQAWPRLRVVDHEKNRGYGAALISGFTSCTKDLIFYTDGDGQYDVREMAALVEQLGNDVDWVNGYKISRSDPLHRIVIGRIYHWLVSLAFGIRLRDVDCDFRLMRRSMFDRVRLKSQSGTICVEMIKKFQCAGFRFREVPVHHFFRAYGTSQFFNFHRLARIPAMLAKLWWELVIRKKVT